MKTTIAVAAMLLAAAPLFAEPITFESAETPVTLIELFTSEGCSSCPPADAWVSKLKTSQDLWKSVVPVVFHVDYWNGLGWPDRFATRANTDRQHRYAAAWRSNSVYTPGFVLNGREWRDWNGRAPQPAPGATKVGKLQVTLRDRTHAEVTFTPIGNAPKPLQVELALLGGNLESDVKRGENSGRKLRHDFVVLHLATAALTSDGKDFTASISLPEKISDTTTALAAWVTTGDAQPPIQAIGGWLTTPKPCLASLVPQPESGWLKIGRWNFGEVHRVTELHARKPVFRSELHGKVAISENIFGSFLDALHAVVGDEN